MVTFRDSWEWDIAAGALIAAEAGARVTNRSGEPLAFNNDRPANHGVVAAAPGAHEVLMAHRAGALPTA
jgi:myo-inositol-1(or 4)-monophosphatase